LPRLPVNQKPRRVTRLLVLCFETFSSYVACSVSQSARCRYSLIFRRS
jgi:hypothetical protein